MLRCAESGLEIDEDCLDTHRPLYQESLKVVQRLKELVSSHLLRPVLKGKESVDCQLDKSTLKYREIRSRH